MRDAQSIPSRSGDESAPAAGSQGAPRPRRQLVHAAMVADADHRFAPGAVLLEGNRVLASGSPESIGACPPDAALSSRPDCLVCPPLVNAHVHLDLSDLSAPDQALAFHDWLGRVRDHRLAQRADGAIERAMSIGVEASWAGGCPFVGDICGSRRAFEALEASSLRGIAYLEIMGHSDRIPAALDQIEWVQARDASESGPSRGLSPHAPYSAALAVYEAAAASGLPVVTHLAESLDELAWAEHGGGFFAEMLTRFGYQPGEVESPGRHPVDAVLDLLPSDRSVAVHMNYLESRHLEQVRHHGLTVVYCPRASRFLGHPADGRSEHAWRSMLAADIPVALGTDGRPCLPGPGPRGRRLSVLDDALQLIDEGASLEQWLPMATVHGARALGLDRDEVTLAPGMKQGLIAITLTDISSCRPDPEEEIEWLNGTGQRGGGLAPGASGNG